MPNRRTRFAAYAYVRDADRILLTQLATGEPDAGAWTLPGGGIDWGEHPEDALQRELHEETSLRGSVGDLLSIDSRVFPYHAPTGRVELHTVRLIYHVEAKGEPRVVEVGGSTSAAAWFELGRLGTLSTIDLVSMALSAAAGRGL